MFDKIILIHMLIMILLGAAMIAFPIALVWGILCLIFIGLWVTHRSQLSR
jgi:hypothetical protein